LRKAAPTVVEKVGYWADCSVVEKVVPWVVRTADLTAGELAVQKVVG
jgi:hypothetical protein